MTKRSTKPKAQMAATKTRSAQLTKAKQFVEKAKRLRKANKFSEGLRTITKLGRDDYDFSSLSEEEAEFAVFWEYRREVAAWCRRPPNRIEGPLWEKWKNNCQFFPLPYLELRRAKLFGFDSRLPAEKDMGRHPMWSEKPSVAFRPTDLDEFEDMLENTNDPRWSLICKFGNKDAFELLDLGAEVSTPARTGYLSMHCVVLDWRRGSKAIRDEMYAWLKKLAKDLRKDQPELRGKARNIEKLFQLGAWRARRAELSAKEYYELRGGKRGSFGKSGNPSYDAPKAFRTAADAAAVQLEALLRKKVSE